LGLRASLKQAETHPQEPMSNRNHKVLNLYGQQIEAFENAREAAKRELDDPTEGEIVRELASAYTGWEG
jgi:hypothetical protein